MQHHAARNMMVQSEGRELVMERIFDAPKELLFQMFAKAEHLQHFWGPQHWTLTVCKVDFRKGGIWHYYMKSPDGQIEAWGKATYQEIDESNRIILIDGFSDAEGNTNPDLPESQTTFTFVEHGNQTKLVLHTLFASEEDLRKTLEMQMLEGMADTLDRLAARLDQVQK
jgi:uncharacterized protein YndB with AHSA1/START domain